MVQLLFVRFMFSKQLGFDCWLYQGGLKQQLFIESIPFLGFSLLCCAPLWWCPPPTSKPGPAIFLFSMARDPHRSFNEIFVVLFSTIFCGTVDMLGLETIKEKKTPNRIKHIKFLPGAGVTNAKKLLPKSF